MDFLSPNWFKCVMCGEYKTPAIMPKYYHAKSELYINGNYVIGINKYPLAEIRELYFNTFFSTDPMLCLKILFDAKHYFRITYKEYKKLIDNTKI